MGVTGVHMCALRGYVYRQATHHRFASGDRPAIWRQAPYHGAAFDQQNRRVAAVGQRPEPHDHAADGRVAVTRNGSLAPYSETRAAPPASVSRFPSAIVAHGAF